MNTPRSVSDYVALLESGTPFTLANIGGDGEFLAITGQVGVNSDGRAFNSEVGRELAKVLLEPRLTFHGYNPGKKDGSGDGYKRRNAERWLREHGINVPVLTAHSLEDPEFGSAKINVRWVHKEILSAANVRGDLGPFIRALRRRHTFVIGSEFIAFGWAEDVLRARQTLRFPTSVGWDDLPDIRQHVAQLIDQMPVGSVVTWSLGYLTKVLMWEAAPFDPPAMWMLAAMRPDLTHIDVGAMWDPYCGVRNRHGYRRETWPDAMAKNLREAGIG